MIPAFDSTRDYRLRRDAYMAAFDRVLSSGKLILGPETEAFEHEFASFVGAQWAVGVSSGTSALTLALQALDIATGDEVLLPTLTAPATAAAIRSAGAIPRFVDVDAQTLTIDPQRAERAITRRTRALIAVHLYGCPADIEALGRLAERYGVWLIEDCAQAQGTRFGRQHVGTFGYIGCFSFYPTKNLGAFGDAGLCVTDDPLTADRLRSLRCYGFDRQRTAQRDGSNSRLDELQAALLRVKLPLLDASIARRRQIADRYRTALTADAIRCYPDAPGHSYHQFVIRVAEREALLDQLTEAGVGYGVHYPMPLHRMPAYRALGYLAGAFPHAEEATRQVVSLPMFPELTDEEVDLVCEAVKREAVARAGA